MSDTPAFLRLLYGNDAPGYLVLWTLQDKRSTWVPARDLNQAARHASRLAGSYDVYFGLGLQPKDLGPYKRGVGADVIAIPGLWADIDASGDAHKKSNLPQSEKRALDILRAFPLKPTVIVHSGHGFHVYWLFPDPWVFKDDKERQEAQALSRRFQATIQALAQEMGCEVDSTPDLARVLRPPSTWNRKREPVQVRILKQEPSRRYAPSDFEPHLVKVEPRQSREARLHTDFEDELVIENGERNNTLTRFGGLLRRYGVGQEAIEGSLLSINEFHCDPPLEEDDVLNVAKSVTRYPRQAHVPATRSTSFSREVDDDV